jgi:dynein heavy chain
MGHMTARPPRTAEVVVVSCRLQPLLIENSEEELDPVLDPVLERRLVKKGKSWVFQLADKEVCACATGLHHSTRSILPVRNAHIRFCTSHMTYDMIQATWRCSTCLFVAVQVDFTDSFKLFCTTRLPNPHFTPELSAKVTVVDFTVTMAGEFSTRKL